MSENARPRFQRLNVNCVVAGIGGLLAIVSMAVPNTTAALCLMCAGSAAWIAAFLAEAFA